MNWPLFVVAFPWLKWKTGQNRNAMESSQKINHHMQQYAKRLGGDFFYGSQGRDAGI